MMTNDLMMMMMKVMMKVKLVMTIDLMIMITMMRGRIPVVKEGGDDGGLASEDHHDGEGHQEDLVEGHHPGGNQ